MYPATFHRTSFDQWETVKRPDLGLSFEKPKGLKTLGSSTSVLIQLHGVSAQSTFPSDTQYLITISIDTYSREEWASDLAFQMKINEKVRDKNWLDFRQWAYTSLNSDVTTWERDGERLYRRAITNSQGMVVRVSTEYILKISNMIDEDDASIRRIMSSVEFIEEKKIRSRSATATNAVSNVSTNK